MHETNKVESNAIQLKNDATAIKNGIGATIIIVIWVAVDVILELFALRHIQEIDNLLHTYSTKATPL